MIGVPGYVMLAEYFSPPTAPFDPSTLPMNLDPKTQYVGSSMSSAGGFGPRDGGYGIYKPIQFFNGEANSYAFTVRSGFRLSNRSSVTCRPTTPISVPLP
jgi:hypothetical protein